MKNFSSETHLQETKLSFLEREWRFVIFALISILGCVATFSNFPFAEFKNYEFEYLSPFLIDAQSVSESAQSQDNNIYDNFQITSSTYHFSGVASFDRRVDLSRVNELTASEFKNMTLGAIPKNLRSDAAKYIDHAIVSAEKHQVDPFWVLAIMWTESHFKQDAKSYVNAKGLMQIMPDTSVELSRQLRFAKNPKVAKSLAVKPRYNVEMGAFYLKQLENRFNANHKFATVAYNMGPGWVKKRINRKMKVGNRNIYFNKVKRAYASLSRPFIEYTKNNAPAFLDTYVVKKRIYKASTFEFKFMKFVKNTSNQYGKTIVAANTYKKFQRPNDWIL